LGQPEDWALNGSELERIHAFGFDILKVKAGDDLPAELAEITDLARWAREFEVRIRIDFNEKPSFEAVEKFLVELATATEGLDWLDWVEDPCVFDREHWRILAQQSGVRLALDRPYIRGIEAEECLGAVGVLVVKPAVSSPDAAIEFARQLGMPVAVTSYLDHAVGQVGAAWIAARALAAGVPMDECGLITHRAYEDDAFSETLGYRDARLEPPSGFGIGFDEELHRVRWEVIP
jgi:L-alanine-DL-glutamate epimerase-like enolase superfamily enzyme